MINQSRGSEKKGTALALAVLVLTVLMILVPSMVMMIQRESKNSVSSSKKLSAFHLAEAALDRGSWKLRESDAIWTSAVSGSSITSYANDIIYTEIAGGTYKVLITSGPGLGQVTVIGKGRVTSTGDVRAIKAVFSKGNAIGALSVNGALAYKPNLLVEWGPVVCYNSITQAPLNYYPRKYSAGQIVGRDTVNDSNNGALPSENWAAYDYASFYDLGSPPTIDLATYLTRAKNSAVPYLKKGTGSGNASPYMNGAVPSGYYPSSTNPNGVKIEKGTGAGDYDFRSSTSVIYIEGPVQRYPSGTWLDIEALIVTGDCDFNAGGSTFSATIPTLAQDQYKFSPTAVTYWNSNGWTNGATIILSDIGFHGFLYVGGDVGNAGGGSTMVGALYVGGNITTNTTTVYYDQNIVTNIRLSNSIISRVSWDEVSVAW